MSVVKAYIPSSNTVVDRLLEGGRVFYTGSAVVDATTYDLIDGTLAGVQNHDAQSDKWVAASSFGSYATGTAIAFYDDAEIRQVGTLANPNSATTYKLDFGAANKYGWVAVTNPYSFPIPLNSDCFSADEGVEASVRVRTLSGSGYAYETYNIKTGVSVSSNGTVSSGFIAPYQTFWLKASKSGKTFTIDPTSLTIDDLETVELKSARVRNDVLRLAVSAEGKNTDEVALVFADGTFDQTTDDSGKLNNADDAAIYSIKDVDALAVSVFPNVSDIVSGTEFKLGVRLPKGVTSATISAANISVFDGSVNVFLNDKLTGDVVNLRTAKKYAFTAEDGAELTDRFTVSFLKSVRNLLSLSPLWLSVLPQVSMS